MRTVQPRLVVRGADAAIAFYERALGARLVERHVTPSGHVVHAELAIGEARFALTEEQRAWHNDAPASLGGTTVLLSLECDPDEVAARIVAGGGEVVFPVADQFYGERGGRLRDPFGHCWMLWKKTEDLTTEEIERRMAAWQP